ncbi:MAG: flagellar biosynthetic protein FliR [Proteocatella sp.]
MINEEQLLLWTLIFIRCTGFILLNPILGRRNLPPIVKSGFIMALSFLLFVYSPVQSVRITGPMEYMLLLLKELMIGYCIGYIMQMITYMCVYAGGFIDFQVGLSMSTIYDPQNNVQMPLTGNLFNILCMLIFFAVDAHLALIRIFIEIADIVPYGSFEFTANIASFLLKTFSDFTVLAIQLAFPIIIIIFLTEAGVGILMKAIPQINVFVVNIQAKILIAMVILVFMFSPIGDFLNNAVIYMINSIRELALLMQ